MSTTTLFNTSFLICLGILLSVIGLLAYLFNQKISQQNHKIASMFELVSTMAQELNAIRGLNRTLNVPQSVSSQMPASISGGNPLSLIPVSDDDSEEYSDEDDDDDVEEEDDDDEDGDDDENEEDEDEKIKSISLNEQSMFNLGDNLEELNVFENVASDDDDDDDGDDDDDDDIDELIDDNDTNNTSSSELNAEADEKPISLIRKNNADELDAGLDTELEDYSKLNFEQFAAEDIKQDLTSLKTIHISDFSDLEEIKAEGETESTIDFKKLSLAKLRSIVSEKGLSKEANKLKKNDLIKLLEA